MHNKFLITFDSMPRGTAQMKRYNSYTRTYFKSKALQETHKQFALALKPYKPKKPSEAPIKLCIWLAFDIKSPKRLWGTWKTTKPDCDNYVKEFIDVMTELGWWKDDSQIVDLRIRKTYAEKASIFVVWEELKERPE